MLEESRKETAPAPLPASGPELAAMMKIGTRVMRGVDWKWGDQVSSPFYIQTVNGMSFTITKATFKSIVFNI